MWDQVDQLHLHHGEVPPETRVLKLTEEIAAEALIGLNRWNSRKGKCRTRDDVLDELADVVITEAVAMAGIAPGATDAEERFQRRLSTVVARAGLSSNASASPRAAPSDNTVTFVTSNPAKLRPPVSTWRRSASPSSTSPWNWTRSSRCRLRTSRCTRRGRRTRPCVGR